MIRRIFGLVVGFVLVAFFVTGANAAITNVGDLGDGSLSIDENGTFTQSPTSGLGDGEVLDFMVEGDSNFSGAATEVTLDPVIGITGFGVALIEDVDHGETAGDFSSFIVLDSDSGSGLLLVSASGLQSGKTYGLLFTGTVTGTSGGLYTGAFAVSAVPLPPAAWLFLSSLVGLAGVVRHRRRKKVVAPKQRELAGNAPEAAIAV